MNWYPNYRNENIPVRDVHVTWAETPVEDGYYYLKEGEVIEFGDEHKFYDGWRISWYDGLTILPHWVGKYRRKIKATPIQPKYRPYNSCMEAAKNLEGKFVKVKNDPDFIVGISSIIDGVKTTLSAGNFTFKELLEIYEFLDGSPCGVLDKP